MGSYYAGIMNSKYSRELRHHGIIGQKWGVQNGPPYPLSNKNSNSTKLDKNVIKNIKGAKTSNLDKWGKDAEHNVLYIAGYSGSGKSTTALGLKKPGDTVIHLDGYVDAIKGITSLQDKKFNSYMDANVPNWRKMANIPGIEKFSSKDYWNAVDSFIDGINSYSIKEYKNGHRVIVEGVQIADDWWGDPKKLNGKPMIVLGTNPIISMTRAFERDGGGNLFKGLSNINNAKKNLSRLSKVTESKRRQQYIPEFIR